MSKNTLLMVYKNFGPVLHTCYRRVSFTVPACARGRGRDTDEPPNLEVFRTQAEILKEQISNVHLNPALHYDTLSEAKKELDFSPKNSRCLRVSVLGVPNSGKSTFINRLVGHNVCAHSKKVHTTRTNARAVLTDDLTQIVFLDTPGIVTKEESIRFNLEDKLLKDPSRACQKADLIVVLQDVSNRFTRESINKSILKLLCWNQSVPTILVLNKMDKIPHTRRVYDLIRKLSCGHLEGVKQKFNVKKTTFNVDTYLKRKKKERNEEEAGRLAEESNNIVINNYNDFMNVLKGKDLTPGLIENLVQGLVGWPNFKEVFSVSSLTGEGIDSIRDYFLDQAYNGPWDFPPNIYSDDDPRDIVTRIVKSKFLDVLPTDVPYRLQPVINTWIIENGVLRVGLEVDATSSRSIHLLLGNNAEGLGQVARLTETDLMNFFQCEVFVNISVNVNTNTPAKRADTLKPEFLYL